MPKHTAIAKVETPEPARKKVRKVRVPKQPEAEAQADAAAEPQADAAAAAIAAAAIAAAEVATAATPAVDVAIVKVRAKRRFRRGTKSLRRIRKAQLSDKLVMPRASVRHLMRRLADGIRADTRFTAQSFEALQEAVESFMHDYLVDACRLSVFRRNKGVGIKDMVAAAPFAARALGPTAPTAHELLSGNFTVE